MQPTAAMLVIGDEILSGRTRDANMYHLAQALTGHGIDLLEVRVVADDRAAIVDATRALAAAYTHVFTSGGIGPTHDDITAECVAEAMGDTIDVRADARALLEAHYARSGVELNAARLRMARIPSRAVLIDNPVSTAPGFSLENVHVMAGVPAIFEAMLAGLLPSLAGGAKVLSEQIYVDAGEGDIAAQLTTLVETYADLSFGSYPFQRDGRYRVNVVIRGTDATRLAAAKAALLAAIPGAEG